MGDPHSSDEPPSNEKRARSRKAGVTLIILGLIIGPCTFVAMLVWLVLSASQGTQFSAPGEHVQRVEVPGSYTIWHEEQGTYQGKYHFSRVRNPEGIIEVLDTSGGQLPLTSGGGSMEMNSTRRSGLASFYAPTAGDYRIRATGFDEPIVLFVSKGSSLSFPATILGGMCSFAVGMGMIVAGLSLTIPGFLSRRFARPQGTPSDIR